MSDHFKHSLKLLALGVALLLGLYLWLMRHLPAAITRRHDPIVALPKGDKEKITYNDKTHEIAITTDKGTTYQYSRDPVIEQRQNGDVVVSGHSWGLERRFFGGVGYCDGPRVYVGAQVFYWHQFDLSGAVGIATEKGKHAFQLAIGPSWNFYSNTSLHLAVNPVPLVLSQPPDIGAYLSIRF